MELEITMFSKRAFIWLGDGWYILNDANDTNSLLLDYHCMTVVRKNNVHVVYYEDLDSNNESVDVRVFDKDGYLFADTFALSYEELKEASKRILEKDAEGLRLFNMMNDDIYNNPTYVEYKGDKTND